MDRRKFIVGLGAAATGGSALIGTGAFSRIESQRRVTIQVAEDPDAYLGLDACDTLHGDNFVDIDSDGHLAVDIGQIPEEENPIGGSGVNSDSRTWFDNVVQICNQGKQAAAVYIEEHEDWPYVSDDKEERRVDFYVGDERERSVVGEANAAFLDVGECTCIGIRTTTHGLDADGVDSLLEALGDTVTIVADVDGVEAVGPVWNLTKNESYSTIQGAVDDADGGDNIYVTSGSYEEQVIIDRSLTLQGADGATILGPSARESFSIPEDDDRELEPVVFAYGGQVDSDSEITGSDTIDLDVSGLTIDGQDRSFETTYFGLALRNVHGTVTDTVIERMTTGNGQSGGISVYGDSSVDILRTTVSGYERVGIVANGDYGGLPDPEVLVQDCEVIGPGTPVSGWAPNGIQLGAGTTGKVLGNRVTGHQYDGSTNPGGILAFGAHDVRIADNVVLDNDDGVQVFGDFFFGSDTVAENVEVEDNEINANEVGVVIASLTENVHLDDNEITSNDLGVSIAAYDGVDGVEAPTITNNELLDNDDGIDVVVSGTGEVTNATIDSNTFEDAAGFYVSDEDDQVDLSAVLNDNSFDPSAVISGDEIVPDV
ncbi:MAG: right-handed parallel beta-helix repeat-containing protein [archaeon]